MTSTDGDGVVRTTGSENSQPSVAQPAPVIQIDENNGRNDIVGIRRGTKEKEKDVEEVRLKSKRHRDHNVASKSRSSEQERPSNHNVATNNRTSELTLSFEGKVYVFNGVALEKVQAVLSYLGGTVTAINVPVIDQSFHRNTMAMVNIPQHLNLSRRYASVIRFREKQKERVFDKRPRYITQNTQKDVSQRMDSKHKGCTLELNDAVQKDSDPPSVVNCNIEIKVPKLGMVFQTDDQAYDYYNRYARSVGFSIRRNSTTRRVDRTVSKRTFCCSQEGKYRSHSRGSPKKQRSNTRTDCKACFAIKIQGDGNYSLVEFVEEHNHELVPPSEVHILRSHRKSVGNEYRNAQLGGSQDINLMSASCANCMQLSKTSDSLKKGDTQLLLDYFKYMQKENPYFFYSLKLDENNQTSSCFWCDAKSRIDYSYFGDVICLDTKHRLSNYDKPYALFVGLNNHGQPILFGCALLLDETKESMVWAFETFFDAMNRKEPKTIFTDQSPVIIDAVSQVFPYAHHRICLRHLHQNVVNHFSDVVEDYSGFMKDFKRCIYENDTEEEFQISWNALIDRYNLAKNEWLKGIYDTREKWAQVYGREHFCAGLTTIQRSEDVDDYLKRYFKRHMPLQDILTQYEKALSHRRGKERDEDFISRRTKPNLRTTWPVEVRVAERYTANLFALFQEEYVHTLDVFVDAADEDGSVCIYKVSSFENIKPHTVTYDSSDKTVKCSCNKFEMRGILCAHALKILHSKQLPDLPPQYYVNRWTKEARDGVVFEYHEKSPKVDFFSSFTLLYTDLAYIAVTIAVKGASTESSCTFTKGLLIRVLEELDHFLKSDSDQTKALEDAVLTLRDRPLKKLKGKVSGTNKGTPEKGKRNGKSHSRPTGTDRLNDQAPDAAAAIASVPSMTSGISNIPIPSVRPWSMSYTEEPYLQVEQELLPHSGIDGTQFGLVSGGLNVQHAWEGVVAPQNEIGYPRESGLEALSLGPTRPLSMPQVPSDKVNWSFNQTTEENIQGNS